MGSSVWVTSRSGCPISSLCAAYYTEVLGLREVERVDNRVYLKGWDEHDHHSVILTEAARYGVEHLAFKSESVDDLEGYESVLERYGCTVERLAARGRTGPRRRHPLRLAERAHLVDLRPAWSKVGNGLPRCSTRHPCRLDLVGIAPPRLDHCLLTTENVPDAARFMQEALRFRLTEQIISNEGHQLIVFLERSRTSRTTSPSPAGPAAVCTTSPSGWTAGRTSGGPRTSSV